jgi:hypothetical protein
MAKLALTVEVQTISGDFAQKTGDLMEEINKTMYSDGEILKMVKKVKGIIIANLGKTKDNPTTFQWTTLVKKNWNTYIQATWLD